MVALRVYSKTIVQMTFGTRNSAVVYYERLGDHNMGFLNVHVHRWYFTTDIGSESAYEDKSSDPSC